TNLEKIVIYAQKTDILDSIINTDATIYCYENSDAHYYALENNLKFVLMEKSEITREVGDLNNDGVVELTDLTILSLYLIGDRSLDESDLVYADVTKNGKVDIADLAALKQYIMKS
ncbi:MAG: dockerin type I repeat-containing protein, partial [Oscillospiraceae bacterium]|nr:dockerin type I repeat-containing protein [Oscillospiraceae bacterium]